MMNTLKYLISCLLFVLLITGGIAKTEFHRIISLSPNITEILHLLGLDDKVVAVTDHCHIETLRVGRPSIGTFFSPNIEQIILLKPDLVIALPSQNNILQRLKLALKNTEFLAVQDETTSDVIASVITIGRITNTESRASVVVKEFQHKIAHYKSLTQHYKIHPRV
ncbi:MAG: ABC transporter substrate-binding protein, partial [Candidatus Sumerlaeia bacterium]|nr:ABC transporter substrate-binding protein [Candidatus Sumerlaeia bacterium]